MHEFINGVHFFTEAIDSLKKAIITLQSPLEEIVISTCGDELAYIDDRKSAKRDFGYDFWRGFNEDQLNALGVKPNLLYSTSQRFPDFLFKTTGTQDRYIGGSLLELKDSKGGSVASFNSTVPTKHKSLEEIDIINGKTLVSRIASIKDIKLALHRNYLQFQRRCFYLIRTHKGSGKVKVSLVDGSFFETIPKDHLFYQMFLNILQAHLHKKKIEIPKQTLQEVHKALSYITDQTLIAGSQLIEKASVKPRLRIMAEVHPEGNPHSAFYPQIIENSFNLILESSPQVNELKKELTDRIPEIKVFSIFHKRNGEHIVFQFRKNQR